MTADMPSVLEAAHCYVNASLSVLPIDSWHTKKPVYGLLPVIGLQENGSPRRGWSPFKNRRPTEEELQSWFSGLGSYNGIAVVCGDVSGGLEIIDIDSDEYVQPWMEQVESRAPGLIDRLILVKTPRPGRHVYYRCSSIGGNQKLAQKIVTNPATGMPETKTLIETRGEGGYALIPPTPWYCHPNKRPYQYCTERTLVDVQEISVQERDLLLEVSRSFNATPYRQPVPHRRATIHRPTDLRRPDDDFNSRADWTEILEGYGWSLSHRDLDGKEHWTRPGKTEGTSATLNYEGNNLFHVFSSNADPLEQEKSYTKFHFFATMECEGDFSRAMRELASRGFGQQIPAIRNQPRHGRRREDTSRRRRSDRR